MCNKYRGNLGCMERGVDFTMKGIKKTRAMVNRPVEVEKWWDGESEIVVFPAGEYYRLPGGSSRTSEVWGKIGDHDYAERACPKCEYVFCWSCCGSTNVHEGGHEKDYMLCPACSHDVLSNP